MKNINYLNQRRYFIFKGVIKRLQLIINRNNENQKIKGLYIVNLEFYSQKKMLKNKGKINIFLLEI